jgi:hypothetical protein
MSCCAGRHTGGRIGRVELHDFGAAPLARIRDRDRHTCFTVDIDGVARERQRAVLERRVAESMAEREERRGRHIEITLVDVRLGSPIAAAGLLGVVDRHLPDVPREREGQLPGGPAK